MEKKKVLIIEDESAIRRIIMDKFSESGFSVIEAEDGEVGLRLAFAEKPDIILLDLMMPKVDGLMVMEDLRKDEWGKSVPIIILTNFSADDHITNEVVKHEPSYYLLKTDWPIEEVVEKVRSIIG